MKKSRTTNSFYNFITGIGGYAITTVADFIVRTVFIATLGKGLFSNVLSMLSLAELGVGSAIVYKLYKPLSENDQQRVAILMKFYRRAYTIIGGTIALVGVCIIPLLPTLIKGYNTYANLQLN